MKKRKNYFDNEFVYNEIVKYQKSIKIAKRKKEEQPRLPESIGKAIFDVAKNVASLPQFRGYPFIDEMVSDRI